MRVNPESPFWEAPTGLRATRTKLGFGRHGPEVAFWEIDVLGRSCPTTDRIRAPELTTPEDSPSRAFNRPEPHKCQAGVAKNGER